MPFLNVFVLGLPYQELAGIDPNEFPDAHSGKITRLLADKDGRLGRFVIQARGWSRRKVLVPMDHIERIDEADVYLSITKRDLKRRPTSRPDDVLDV